MSTQHQSNRRISIDHQSQRRESELEGIAPLQLSRTRSHEPTLAEGSAVHESPPDDPPQYLDDGDPEAAAVQWPHHTRYLVMLCAFLTSMSFGVTQVPLLYVLRLMTCDDYYEKHPSHAHGLIEPQSKTASILSVLFNAFKYASQISAGTILTESTDRCSLHAIESSTALSASLLGGTTTVFGILNLFLAGSLVKRIGVKRTLIIQVFFPAVRLLIQNIGVEVWGMTGITIIQCSQVVTVIGGPSGYMLVLNTFITEVVEYEGRTAALGRLAGSMMFGSAMGFLLGGLVADAFGIHAPFRLTLALFLCSSLYVAVCLPYVPLAKKKANDIATTSNDKKRKGISRFLGPLAVFASQKFVTKDGVVQSHYGILLLAIGVYLGVLATGNLPTLLQLYSTDVFEFGTSQNGWLIFTYSTLRGVFLTFAFPAIITIGRRMATKKRDDAASKQQQSETLTESERQPLLTPTPPQANTTGPVASKGMQQAKQQTFAFDLTYARVSLVADGLLTLLCSFVHKGWQMYLVAVVLPFSAGTGSAAKGTVLQMIGSSAGTDERTDALAGLSLVENMARLSTTFVFGVLFAVFTNIGRPELTFACNAAVALLGFVVLLTARFPPEDSHRLSKEDDPTS